MSSSSSSSSSSSVEGISFPWGVFFISLVAYPVCYFLNFTSTMEDSRYVFLAGVIICTAVAPLTYFLLLKGLPAGRDVFFYIFTIFAFTSMVDLYLAFTIDGFTTAVLFYLKEGEVYLTTGHGLWINYWDGTFHYACYLFLTACMLRKNHQTKDNTFRYVGLLWGGSILNSMIVLFAGSAIGLHAKHIKPSYLLNIPYGLFPLIFTAKMFKSNSTTVNHTEVKMKNRSILGFLFDLFLIVASFASIVICIFRVLVVVKSQLNIAEYYGTHIESHLFDSSAYPLVQMLSYAYYAVPFFCYSIVSLYSSNANGHHLFVDLAIFFFGAYLQGTFSYVGAACHWSGAFPSDEWKPQNLKDDIPKTTFIAINSLLLITTALITSRAYYVNKHATTTKKKNN